jgi:hypothetical protein
VAQTSSDGSFSVRHSNKVTFPFGAEQIRDAESIYHSACAIVQRDFQRGAGDLRPRFTVTIGTKRNEVHAMRPEGDQIWMAKWDPMVFAEGVVLAASQSLTRDMIKEMGIRAVRYRNATVDVSGLR